MNNFYIIGNGSKANNEEHIKRIREYIESKGGKCSDFTFESFSDLEQDLAWKAMPDDVECIIVLGGDGTLIRCVRASIRREIPFIGVNFGTLGYLCDIDEDSMQASIDQLLRNDYYLEERMMLTATSEQSNHRIHQPLAVNDVVIYRYGDLRVVDYNIYVNGLLLNTYSADGVIIATPTGSTGYSMSCGGPIVDPAAMMIVITPISPHNLSSKSIVLNPDDIVTVEIGERHKGTTESVKASFDGDEAVELDVGDRIVIQRANESIRLVKLRKYSFLDNIRKKMQEQN